MMMRNVLRFAGILTAGCLGLLAPGRAQAESIYSFNLQGNGVQITGTVTVSDVASGSIPGGTGEYLITTGSVTYNGPDSSSTTVPVTALESPGGFQNNDNYLLLTSPGTPGPGPYLDVNGVSFDIAGHQENVYYSSGNGDYYIENESNYGTGGVLIGSTMTVSYVSTAVPEPASLISVCTGGLLLGGFAWRKRRRTTIAA